MSRRTDYENPDVCSECRNGVQETASHLSFTTRVIPFISQFMSMSDRFSFLQGGQKEAVRSEELNSKAREFCNKEGLF